ncbi:DNA topoisomerase IV [uncultured Algibacter sp.]|uniref:DNA topoisomerase IV n=1 Tax=uncultured Algibacter sp. TaxID=298659 RepID=UPI00262CF3D6|nr:DNA topoisomerase IV [uncultured Algibacter sp.]
MRFLQCLLCLLLLNCYEPSRECKNFRTGKFYSETTINGEVVKSTFERSETLQIESYNNKIDSSKLRWINDCEVIFKTINPKNMAEEKDIHLKILATTDSSYIYEYSYVGETKKQKGLAYRSH